MKELKKNRLRSDRTAVITLVAFFLGHGVDQQCERPICHTVYPATVCCTGSKEMYAFVARYTVRSQRFLGCKNVFVSLYEYTLEGAR